VIFFSSSRVAWRGAVQVVRSQLQQIISNVSAHAAAQELSIDILDMGRRRPAFGLENHQFNSSTEEDLKKKTPSSLEPTTSNDVDDVVVPLGLAKLDHWQAMPIQSNMENSNKRHQSNANDVDQTNANYDDDATFTTRTTTSTVATTKSFI
jgi:hypothetical protein